MIEVLAGVCVLLLVIVIVLVVQLMRRPGIDVAPLMAKLDTLEKLQERSERALKDEFGRTRDQSNNQSRDQREELQNSLTVSTNNLMGSVDRISRIQKDRFDDFALVQKQQLESFAKELRQLTTVVEAKLASMQSDNATKLEEMRKTVDEKLQGTLDKRLGESFKIVNDSLAVVHKGLGDMQNLATGVGDLKRVLTNVKTRGTWAEIQLGTLLEQILTSEQFGKEVSIAGRERVDFAIKLPGRDGLNDEVWLPIDAKFPKEDYERLVDASERGDRFAEEEATKSLENRVRKQARDIREKYLKPPHTTDFALMYLPTEGLYAEVLRRPGLADTIQRESRVVVIGPTTLGAFLNSLQMGFRTLKIQKQSSEIWKVLDGVKAEFGKFGDILDKVKKKLEEAGNVIDDANTRKRAVEKCLKQVESLPAEETPDLVGGRSPSLFDPLVTGK
jgi:DNA recombination protein RmuC